MLNLSHSYMWDVRTKFGGVSEKVDNWPPKHRSQVFTRLRPVSVSAEWKWSVIQRFFLLKPILRVCRCLTPYSTCQWTPLGHLAVSFVGLVQNACHWPIRLPTSMVREACRQRKVPGSFWPLDPSNSKLKPFMYVEDEKKVLTSLRESWQLTLEAPKSSVHPAETGWSAFLLIEAHFGGLLMFDTLFQLSVIPVRSPGCLFC